MINEDYVTGLTVEQAKDYIERNGYELCIVQHGNSPYIATQNMGTKRVNVAVSDGRVSKVIEILHN